MTDQNSKAGTTAKGKSKDLSKTQSKEQPSEYSFVVEGRPKPKARPRMSRKGMVYTPKETIIAEEAYVHALGNDCPVFEGPVEVEMTFCIDQTLVTIKSIPESETKLRGDLDNYVKTCLDGCQRAGIIPNDRLVMRIEAEKII